MNNHLVECAYDQFFDILSLLIQLMVRLLVKPKKVLHFQPCALHISEAFSKAQGKELLGLS